MVAVGGNFGIVAIVLLQAGWAALLLLTKKLTVLPFRLERGVQCLTFARWGRLPPLPLPLRGFQVDKLCREGRLERARTPVVGARWWRQRSWFHAAG